MRNFFGLVKISEKKIWPEINFYKKRSLTHALIAVPIGRVQHGSTSGGGVQARVALRHGLPRHAGERGLRAAPRAARTSWGGIRALLFHNK